MADRTRIVLSTETIVVDGSADEVSAQLSGMREAGGAFVALNRAGGQGEIRIALNQIVYFEPET